MNEREYTVLVLEDETLIAKDIVNEIEKTRLGFKVVGTAFNGQEGLNLYNELRPDIIFTDIKMPIMDGLEFIRSLRQIDQDTPVVILSGYNEFEYAKQALKLGVEDYLIKPLEQTTLVELLQALKSQLNSRHAKAEKNMMSKVVRGIQSNDELPFRYKGEEFLLLIINVGNLHPGILSHNVKDNTESIWACLYEGKLVSQFFGDSPYWIVDGKSPNIKYVVLARGNNSYTYMERQGQGMFEEMKSQIFSIPIHIYQCDKFIHYKQLQEFSRRLRMSVTAKLVVNKSRYEVLSSISKESKESEPLVLKQTFISEYHHGQISQLQKSLFDIVEEYKEGDIPQRTMENGIIQYMKYLHYHGTNRHKQELLHYEIKIKTMIYEMKSWEELKLELWSLFSELLNKEMGTQIDCEKAVYQVEQYMKKHFKEDILVEEMAKMFHFSSTYLTRAFKKYKKESPLRYLISLRMERAIELMKEAPDKDIKHIAESVGYSDPHYFSRIFKKRMGKTPSEYKNDL